MGRVGRVIALISLVWPAMSLQRWPRSGTLDGGVHLSQGGGAVVVVVASGASLPKALDSLSAAGVRRLDLVVVPKGGPADGAFVAGLRHRWRVGRVLGPPDQQVRGGEPAHLGQRWQVGDLTVSAVADSPHLLVSVAAQPADRRAARPRDGPAASHG